jgi:hypothetical protein
MIYDLHFFIVSVYLSVFVFVSYRALDDFAL